MFNELVNEYPDQGRKRLGKTIIELPYPPSVNRIWRVGKNKRVYKDPAYTKWIEVCQYMIFAKKTVPVLGNYRLLIEAKKPDKRKRDIDNIIKAISDVLETCGIVENDCYCQEVTARWVKNGPELLIFVEKVDDL